MPNSKIKHLSAADLQRGIYIDFEGFKDKAPSILGVLIDDQFSQFVLEPRLQSAAEHSNLETIDLGTLVRRLFQMASIQDRYLVAWSEHELNIIRQYASMDIASRYYNAKYGAKRWRHEHHHDLTGQRATLDLFMKLTGFPAKHGLGKGNAAQRLRHVLNQLEKREEYDNLTRVAKQKWTNLLHYNEQDCRALKHIAQFEYS